MLYCFITLTNTHHSNNTTKKSKKIIAITIYNSAALLFGPRRGGRGERMLVTLLTLLYPFLIPSFLSSLPSPNPFPLPPPKPPTLQRGLLDRPGRRRVHTPKGACKPITIWCWPYCHRHGIESVHHGFG